MSVYCVEAWFEVKCECPYCEEVVEIDKSLLDPIDKSGEVDCPNCSNPLYIVPFS